MKTRIELNEEKTSIIENEEKIEKWKKRVKIVLMIVIPIFIFVSLSLFVLTYVGNLNVIVREYPIYSSKITNDFNSIKIAHFSDLNYDSINMDKIRKTVNVINNTKPDIVVFTGDLVKKDKVITNEEKIEFIDILSKINSIYGKYAIKGENDTNIEEEILKDSSFEILKDENKKIYKGSSFINIASYENGNIENLDNNGFTIFLTHFPDKSDEIINKYNPDVIFSSHSLNGSINIPFIGGIIKRNGAKKYLNRFYEIQNTKIYISGGIGSNDTKFRLFNHPSINFYRLRSVQ